MKKCEICLLTMGKWVWENVAIKLNQCSKPFPEARENLRKYNCILYDIIRQ